jgi:hypothetical protein
MFTLAFWKAAFERAAKTFAQALAALLVADGTNIIATDWGGRTSVAAMAAVVSVLTSVASSGVGDGGPSLGTEKLSEPDAPPVPQDRIEAAWRDEREGGDDA